MTNSWGVWQAYYMETGLSGQSASSLYVPAPACHHPTLAR